MNEVRRGRFRIYWNRSQDFPLCWSIDRGDVSTERTVARVFIHAWTSSNDVARTMEKHETDNVKEPRGWIEGEGTVVIHDDVADVYFGGK
jgi:hypothetical protein